MNWQKLTTLLATLLLLAVSLSLSTCTFQKGPAKVLIVNKVAGFRHANIPSGTLALVKLCKDLGYGVDTTSDTRIFRDETLLPYSAIIFFGTTGDILNRSEEVAMERFIQSGGGFVGIHSATDTEKYWTWYTKLVGGMFDKHPAVQKATLNIKSHEHASTSDIKDNTWTRTDEWYNFTQINKETKVLVTIDEKSYEGGSMGADHPITWFHEYDGGRSWYTAMGHTEESFVEAAFLKHVAGGIRYAVGGAKRDLSKAVTAIPPDEARFVKEEYVNNLDEPMELAVASMDEVFFVERKGALKLYNVKKQELRTIAKMNVTSVHEDGLLGICLDPHFQDNGWLYLYYSPPGPVAKNQLSRFTYANDTIGQERILLEVPTQRDQCCHSAGSLRFDSQGLLWISIGDNTNPFKSDGYSPTDGREGRTAYDAARSSSNSKDLRGKILRIKPTADGSYTIPEGNLFPKDGSQGRPEIYIMGCRNPFRFGVDPRNPNKVTWGDVGPDAGKDSAQGPKGHDEVNVAYSPGYYGWPFFIGNNYTYARWDFDSARVVAGNNPSKPVNWSVNNTGLKNLPAARPATIYYPYKADTIFPWVGEGGRNAMGGPTLYFDPAKGGSQMPAYYNGGTIVWDWMRNWYQVIWTDALGRLTRHEPIFTGLEMKRVIDMEQGPDGSIFVVEYGTNWFTQNEDARLARVSYVNDNRAPVAKAGVDKTVGSLPLTVQFNSAGSFDADPGDKLSYEWRISSPTTINSKEANPKFTFTKAGRYNVFLVVTDQKGNSSSSQLVINAGNEPPLVTIQPVSGNQTFYLPNVPFGYAVNVSDKEDGTMSNGIDPSQVKTSYAYMLQTADQTLAAQGHQENKTPGMGLPGEALIAASDCKSCHHPIKMSVGPSYQMIADRYGRDKTALPKLAKKIIVGGGGSWGEHGMSAHPQLSIDQTKLMVQYIYAWAQDANKGTSIPAAGQLTLRPPAGEEPTGAYVLTASYKDRGGSKGAPRLSSETEYTLRSPYLQGEDAKRDWGGKARPANGAIPSLYDFQRDSAIAKYEQLDLSYLNKVSIRFISEQEGTLYLFADSLRGPLLAAIPVKNGLAWDKIWQSPYVPFKSLAGKHDLYLHYRAKQFDKLKLALKVDWVHFLSGPGAGRPVTMVTRK